MNSKSAASSVTKVVTDAARNLVLLVVVLGALLVWGGQGVQAPWGNGTYTLAEVEVWGSASVAEQVAALGCDTIPALTETVAVKPAGKTGDGAFDSGVVRVVSFDEGFALGQSGKVFVVGWCA